MGSRPQRTVRQQRNPRHRRRHRRRSTWPGRQNRPQQPALRQDSGDVGRRRRRLAHPGAAADAVLPPLPQLIKTATSTSPNRRSTIDVPGGGKTNRRAKFYALDNGGGSHPRQTAHRKSARRQLADFALQGPGRDERRTVVRHHHEPGYPPHPRKSASTRDRWKKRGAMG